MELPRACNSLQSCCFFHAAKPKIQRRRCHNSDVYAVQVKCHQAEEHLPAMLALLESMLQRGSVVCQVRAVAVLSDVGQSLSQAIPGLSDCLRALVQLLASSNQSLLQQALVTTRMLVPLHHQPLVSADVIPALIHLLRHGISTCQAAAASALQSLAEVPFQAASVSEDLRDSISFLLDGLTRHRTAIQLPASGLLASILHHSPVNAETFGGENGPAVIAKAFPHGSPAMKLQALLCLSNAAEACARLHTDITAEMLLAVVTALDAADDALAAQTASLLKHLASSQNALLYRTNVHLKLLAKLTSGSPEVQVQSMSALCIIMAQQPKALDSLSTAAVISDIVKLLKSSIPAVLVAAMSVLCLLADSSPGSRSRIVQAGGLAASVQLLETQNGSVKQQAAKFISSMASGDVQLQKQLAESACIPALVDSLQGSAAEAAAQALAALSSSHTSNQMAIAGAAAIPALADLLRSGQVSEQLAAAQALHSLMDRQPFNVKAAAEAGVPAALLPLLASADSQARIQALSTWQIFVSSHPVVQRVMFEAGGVHELAKAFAHAELQAASMIWRRGDAMLRSICCSLEDAADAYSSIRLMLRQCQQQQQKRVIGNISFQWDCVGFALCPAYSCVLLGIAYLRSCM